MVWNTLSTGTVVGQSDVSFTSWYPLELLVCPIREVHQSLVLLLDGLEMNISLDDVGR